MGAKISYKILRISKKSTGLEGGGGEGGVGRNKLNKNIRISKNSSAWGARGEGNDFYKFL